MRSICEKYDVGERFSVDPKPSIKAAAWSCEVAAKWMKTHPRLWRTIFLARTSVEPWTEGHTGTENGSLAAIRVVV